MTAYLRERFEGGGEDGKSIGKLPLERGAQKLMGENLTVVWAEFSTLS